MLRGTLKGCNLRLEEESLNLRLEEELMSFVEPGPDVELRTSQDWKSCENAAVCYLGNILLK